VGSGGADAERERLGRLAGERRRGAAMGRRRRWFGHSVLELLVVISIILILLAMSFPCYVRAVRMAHEVAEGR
jgi:type II secretory pathway pseudopilin PulG